MRRGQACAACETGVSPMGEPQLRLLSTNGYGYGDGTSEPSGATLRSIR